MAADDDSSDLSSLSSLSPAPSEDELEVPSDMEQPSDSKPGILKFFSKLSEPSPKEPSPPPRKRSPSPPHEYVLADNPDIAFIVMFRNRFHDAFPKSLAHFGPQELERDVVAQLPGDRVESFLCAVLGLLLNRKQDVKPGHYGRALEDAITSHKNQWARNWEGKNPLSGGATFNTMNPTERLTLLRTLILWAMSSSETVKATINQAYKQNRHEDDLNQPRAVQSWGSDGDKRRYFLIEGQDDTNFRVYRESNPQGTNRTWWSVASSIEELKTLSENLSIKDGGPKAKKLSQKMLVAVPRFEAGEEKRRRREYRQTQKERFKRPEPGFSIYEGRTRGKRIKYTYSDDEDAIYSDSTTRRSTRNTGANTPVDTGPVTTSSGRQIRAPPRLNANVDDSAPPSTRGNTPEFDKEGSVGATGRPRRSAAAHHGANGWAESASRSRRNTSLDSDEESEAEFGDDEEDADEHVPEESDDDDDVDEDEIMAEDELDDQPKSLMVRLSITPPKLRHALTPINDQVANTLPTPTPRSECLGDKAFNEKVIDIKDVPASGTQLGESTSAETAPSTTAPEATGQRRETTPDSASRTTETAPTKDPVMLGSPLAFRGSPDKVQARPSPPPEGINGGD